VICSSLADVFESRDLVEGTEGLPEIERHAAPCQVLDSSGRPLFHLAAGGHSHAPDGPSESWIPTTLDDLRRDLFALIDATPHLDWILLTKRPENIRRMWPDRQSQHPSEHYYCEEPTAERDGVHHCRPWYRPNVWLLTSIATQEDADRNVPHLLACRDLVPVLGLSCEPLLGPIDLTAINVGGRLPKWNALNGDRGFYGDVTTRIESGCDSIDWIICGGESGPHARPCDVDWIRAIVQQCEAVRVPCFVKQLGARIAMRNDDGHEWPREGDGLIWEDEDDPNWQYQGETIIARTLDRKGGEPSEWPQDLRVRQFPAPAPAAVE
jgi:protein gp37